ncbi:hypothetical protein [Streptomyces sp. NPDC001508]|uniref:hypothetical protein n=1 Tax=Streptomyces sp. NPDC001508 TaxID=3154656 RepID=UPI0033332FDC
MSAPEPGRRMTVRVDEQMPADLAVILKAGGTTSDAVRLAVAFLAHGYRDIWARGRYPDGVAPAYMRMVTPPYKGPEQRV